MNLTDISGADRMNIPPASVSEPSKTKWNEKTVSCLGYLQHGFCLRSRKPYVMYVPKNRTGKIPRAKSKVTYSQSSEHEWHKNTTVKFSRASLFLQMPPLQIQILHPATKNSLNF